MTPFSAASTRIAQAHDRDALVELLAAAYADSAVAQWIQPDPTIRATAIPATSSMAARQDLWSELEKLHTVWEAHGRPGREQLGLTVKSHQRTLWANTPNQPVHTDLDAVSFHHQ